MLSQQQYTQALQHFMIVIDKIWLVENGQLENNVIPMLDRKQHFRETPDEQSKTLYPGYFFIPGE